MRHVIALACGLLLTVLWAGCGEQGVAPDSSERLPGRAFDAAPLLQADVLYGVNSGDDGLSTIDPETGAVTFVGPLDPDSPGQFTTPIAMAVDPSDYTLYVWNNSPEAGLVIVDPCTGLGTLVNPDAPTQPGLASLAFNGDGVLYGVDTILFEINPATGESSEIGTLGDGIRAGGADFDGTGTLYVVDLTLDPPQRLATVDTGTGQATVVAELSEDIGVVGSIVFDGTGTLLGTGFGGPLGDILFDIDPSDGTVSNVRSITGGGVPQGMGFAPACMGMVAIDIKPGSDTNPINPNSRGVIPVAILGSESFDVESVDETTLAFGPAGASIAHDHAHYEDVNDDGHTDLLAHFRTQETGIESGDTEACLSGETLDGVPFEDCDTIVTVPVDRGEDLLLEEE